MGGFRLTKKERNWVLYDVGNSAFTMLVSTLFPIYFNALATADGISDITYLAYWGYASSIATLCTAIIGPVFGTLADCKGYKKPIFVVAVTIGVLSCAALGLAGGWLAFLGLFLVAKVSYSSSLVFYDAMLPEITTAQRMDQVSSQGYAFGYIGSCIPFVACLALVLGAGSLGMSQVTAMGLAFLLTAVWWLAMTVPLLRCYRQERYVESHGNPFKESFGQLAQTLRSIRSQKHIFLFLLAFFFFIDGVYTVIDMAVAYGTAVGLDTTGLLLALLLTQLVAFPCAIVFGRLAVKYDTGRLIKICILAYTGIALFAVFLTSQWQFWVLAVWVGMFQGGVQALSRSYFGKIIPPEHAGEYFGLFDICGKGAAFMGTTLVSVASQLSGSQSVGVSMLVVVFLVGLVLFIRADAACRQANQCEVG
ncbi:MAG: MFS transporter [Pygmaiobacter massiliensis]|nr:MFS transporter [Pygmaiobacter massiliensis]